MAAAAAANSGAAAPTAAGPARERVLIVVEPAGASVEALARATGLAPYDAQLLARRGGLHLWRALDAGEAREAAARIAGHGVRVFEVPEAEARQRPLRVSAGERRGRGLLLRGEEGAVEVSGDELLLIVAGEIAREHAPRFARRRVDTARLAQGWLVHLHRSFDLRPIEVDATSFAPGFAVTGSSRLELRAWLDEIAPAVPRDDGFRWQPAALSPAEPDTRGPLAAVSSLRAVSGFGRPARSRGAREEQEALLDNVAQFRFYSGWRAALERRRRGSPPAPAAC